MKKILLSIFAFASLSPAICQKQSYTPAELKRIADLGRIWGMVNYFHPAMGTGKINTGDLVVKYAEALAANPSAENFKVVVNKMLGMLNDPSTNLSAQARTDSALLFKSNKEDAAVHKLASGYWYIALPTLAVSNTNIMAIPGMLPDQWDTAKGIIMDLRNVIPKAFTDYDFMFDALPLLQAKLAGNSPLPGAYERVVFHNGLVPQEDGENSVHYSGWKTITRATTATQVKMPGLSTPYNKPFAVVVNSGTSLDLLKRLLSLRAAGKCLVVYEGSGPGYAPGKILKIPVADAQIFNLRTSDLVFGENDPAPAPDMIINKITDFSEDGSFLQQCVALLNKGLPAGITGNNPLSLKYVIPRFEDTQTGFMVSTGYRLFALYNHWNAIQYFFPYKHLLQKDWNNILEEHLPAFIQAKDSVEYNFALRKMIAEIHDSHGFFRSPKGTTPVRYELGSWPAIDV
ncbi:MAG: hypothetical protein H7X88_13395, partial [Gloeobacteraceae cyanobacterium ES-bin-316]|nr:hypothetical protein [Ferruginibacter sp.]